MIDPSRRPTSRSVSRRAFLGRSAQIGALLPAAGGGLSLLLGGQSVLAGSTSARVPRSSGTTPLETVEQSYITSFGFTMSFIEAMVAKEEGFWAEEGLEIDIQGGQGTATSIQALLGGSSNYSRSGGVNSIIAIANESAPIINIATARQRSQFEVVSLPETPLATAADLEGTTVGIVSAGGQTENLLDLMLVASDVPLDSVQRPVTGVGAAAYQLATEGAVDAWISVDTDRASIEESEGIELVHFNTDEAVTMPSDSFICGTELAQAGSDTPTRFLAGLLKAMEFIMDPDNHERAVEHLRRYNPDVPAEAALFELPMVIETWTAAGDDRILDLIPEVWSAGQDTLLDAGQIEQAVDVSLLIDPQFIDMVKGR